MDRTDGLQTRFDKLVRLWREDIACTSNFRELVEHPAYRAIVAMGNDAVPMILREFEHRPDHWHRALAEITGAVPETLRDGVSLAEAAAAWTQWGRDHGYSW